MGRVLKGVLNDNRGFAALFGVITFSLLLVTISVSSSRLASSELRQASEVDRSGRALKAAEAGLEEALQRIDNNLQDVDEDLSSTDSLQAIFGSSGATQANGDMAVLIEENGSTPASLTIEEDVGQDGGALAWRNRTVRPSSFDKIGIQVKDEIIEMDLSNLNELDDNGEICGDVGSNIGCNGTLLHPEVDGVRYCPVNIEPPTLSTVTPEFEFIVLSYAANNPANITVNNRYIIDQNATSFPARFSGSFNYGTRCIEYDIPDSSTQRYIFRIKPIFEVGNVGDVNLFSEYKVSYRAEVLTDNATLGEIAIADNSILIDVTGESGDVRRRIIAKKQRNGRLLGVFDYLLYSGDPSVPLCKAGVLYEVDDENGLSYNLNSCTDSTTVPVDQPPVVSGDIEVGCTDPDATNPTDGAIVDDGTCAFAQTFNYTGGIQQWPVPDGVTQVEVRVVGASGGDAPATSQGPAHPGGLGGSSVAIIDVSGLDALYVCVGGSGSSGTSPNGTAGGFNGGGRGGSTWGASGGGASDVRTQDGDCDTNYDSRLLIAGGGGGGDGWFGARGGHGGEQTGQNSQSYQGTVAQGGTQNSLGGRGGCSGGYCGSSGVKGRGGNNAYYSVYNERYSHGGGGGGGYYGGGGGSPWSGGGGGSNYASPTRASSVEHHRGVNSGHGLVIINPL